MALAKVQRVSTVMTAIDQIRSEIKGGRWSPGDRLPPEIELTKILGISRASLREAIRALTHAGLLSSKQGDGTYVVAVDEAAVALSRKIDSSSPDEVTEVRQGLDAVAVQLAAGRRTDSDLERMREALDARGLAAATNDADGFVAADIQFHTAVARSAHNQLLTDLYESLSTPFRRSLGAAIGQGTADHESLYTAIRDRDPAGATEYALAIIARMTDRDSEDA
jgi:DNA-binding FadR family transcriptional regulator